MGLTFTDSTELGMKGTGGGGGLHARGSRSKAGGGMGPGLW